MINKPFISALMVNILAIVPNPRAYAQSNIYRELERKSVDYIVDGVRVRVPDWMQINFANLPPISSSGEVIVPRAIANQLGYNPNRSWQAGQTADTYLMLGDFADSFQLQELAIANVAEIVGWDSSNINLQDFELISWQTAETLAEAIPGLRDLPIDKVEPLYDLFRSSGYRFNRKAKIGRLLNRYDDLKDLKLENLGDALADYSLDDIPGLSETKLEEYEDWQRSYIEQVPGLKYVPFALFPVTWGNLGFSVLGKADVVFSAAEHGDPSTSGYFITGGASGGTARKPEIEAVDCEAGEPCSYLELEDLFGIGDVLHGKRWGSGETQQTPGGFGILSVVNGRREPTGLLPFGSAFKVVMTGANESQGVAEFGLYFRACMETIFTGYTCTPFFIGPVPWFPVREKDSIIVFSTVNSFQVNVPENYQQQIQDIIAAASAPTDPCTYGCISGDGQTTGTFTHPIALGTRVSSPYGWRNRPFNGQVQFHNGIDYAAPLGTTVKSVDGGVVVRVGSSSCPDFGNSQAKRNCGGQLGNWIDIRHADGKVVRYGHLQQGSIQVREGMSISQGQAIASVGNSGWSTGPHLDLRVHDGRGNYENPDLYIQR